MYGVLHKEHFVFCYYFKMVYTQTSYIHKTYTLTVSHTHFNPKKNLKLEGGCVVRQSGI